MAKKNKNNKTKVDSMITPDMVENIVQDARDLIDIYDEVGYEHKGLPVVAAGMLEKELDLLSLSMTTNNGHVIIKGMKGFEAIDGSFFPNTTGEQPKILRNIEKDYETTVGINFPCELSANVVTGLAEIMRERIYSGSEVSKFVIPAQVEKHIGDVVQQAKPHLIIKEFTKNTYMQYLNWAKKNTKNPQIVVEGITFNNYDFTALRKVEENYQISIVHARPVKEGMKVNFKKTIKEGNNTLITNYTGDIIVKETDKDTMGELCKNICGYILKKTTNPAYNNHLEPKLNSLMKKMINESYFRSRGKSALGLN